jgi:hypothetical protein
MAKKPKSEDVAREAKIARAEDFSQSKTPQMELFELVSFDRYDTAERTTRNRYSNTIELYDFTPKYVWGKQKRIQGKFLDTIKRPFVCRGQQYTVTVSPARIEGKDGIFRDHFPGKREELVEDALRKIATRGNAVMFDELAGVTFTFYELQQELKRNGHSYSINELKDALKICGGTHLTITSTDGSSVLMSSVFECIGLHTREEWKGSGKKTRAFVRFNSLVTQGITNRQFRLYDYDKTMRYTNVIARQLHKRMTHHYKQASYSSPYTITLTTIIRDFGLTLYTQLRDNLRDVEQALQEMQAQNVVMRYEVERITDATRHHKLLDAKITITPDLPFVNEIKESNIREREVNLLAAPSR